MLGLLFPAWFARAVWDKAHDAALMPTDWRKSLLLNFVRIASIIIPVVFHPQIGLLKTPKMMRRFTLIL